FWTFWQYDNSGSLPGDQNLFNGSMARLKELARGPRE
ncbi:hydrolase, partial [Streptomyces sp. NPDC057757]